LLLIGRQRIFASSTTYCTRTMTISRKLVTQFYRLYTSERNAILKILEAAVVGVKQLELEARKIFLWPCLQAHLRTLQLLTNAFTRCT
jgi:hypothetical protein